VVLKQEERAALVRLTTPAANDRAMLILASIVLWMEL
jgi:hypothetical protein